MKDFETKNLKIRKFRLEDAGDVHKNLATESQLAECLGYNKHESIQQTETMVASYIKEYEMNELIWAIEEKSSSEVIGFINAFERSDVNRVCKFNFGIALNKVNTGLMEEALKVIVDYLFNEKGFDVLISEFYDGCKKIVKIKRNILENIGMTEEAVLHKRKINKKTGVAENKVIYSIFKQ